MPFGGVKQSGNGRDKSYHSLEEYSDLKTVWVSLATYRCRRIISGSIPCATIRSWARLSSAVSV
ncbi:aldehyde dehydrogenase family protein [Pistricoccus aurantiacus]|uniref:Aldehyde dehydrogenase family protein n=1 Tax=Pistricoccus aurantiacus TaxID=1883414 RepID=A0A5B8SSA1_9GAMM|nr:aldehyde dehydrogenase family protein [Pistricoccus aurantiacus]